MNDELARLALERETGAIDARGEERLTLLLQDPANRRRYLELLALTVALVRAPARPAAAVPAPARRPLALIVTAAVAACVVAAVVQWRYVAARAPSARVIGVLAAAAPGAAVERSGSLIAAAAGMEIRDGDAIHAALGSARVAWAGEDTTVGVALGGDAVLRATAAGKRIELRLGELDAEVAPQPADRPLVVTTPEGDATVVGTRFRIAREAAGARLAVEHGAVRLLRRADGAEILVAAGGDAVAAPAVAMPALPAAPTMVWSDWSRSGSAAIWLLPDHGEIDADAASTRVGILATAAPFALGERAARLAFTFVGPVRADGWKLEVVALCDGRADADAAAWEVEPRDRDRNDLAAGAHVVVFTVSARGWRVELDGDRLAHFRYADSLADGAPLRLGVRATAAPGTAPLAIAALSASAVDTPDL